MRTQSRSGKPHHPARANAPTPAGDRRPAAGDRQPDGSGDGAGRCAGGAAGGRRGDVAGPAPEADLELAFAWSHGPAVRPVEDRDALFRFPAADDPEPRARRVLAIAVWATAVTVAGLIAAARGAIVAMIGPVPGWYQPAMVASGLGCLALTIAAFLTMHRRWAPWLLLSAATLTLLGNMAANARLP